MGTFVSAPFGKIKPLATVWAAACLTSSSPLPSPCWPPSGQLSVLRPPLPSPCRAGHHLGSCLSYVLLSSPLPVLATIWAAVCLTSSSPLPVPCWPPSGQLSVLRPPLPSPPRAGHRLGSCLSYVLLSPPLPVLATVWAAVCLTSSSPLPSPCWPPSGQLSVLRPPLPSPPRAGHRLGSCLSYVLLSPPRAGHRLGSCLSYVLLSPPRALLATVWAAVCLTSSSPLPSPCWPPSGQLSVLRPPLPSRAVIVSRLINVPATCKVYLRDGSAHNPISRAATLRQKLLIKQVTSPKAGPPASPATDSNARRLAGLPLEL